jgi:RNA polymerase sigma factor (TIGR02999 family)
MTIPEAPRGQVTRQLLAWSAGDEAALQSLIPIVLAELRRLAKRSMRRERAGHTLQTSALVNEAYLRLIDARGVAWRHRAHFFAVAAQTMRRILVDFARSRRNLKRGGGALQLPLDEACVVSPEKGADLLALDEALERLAAFSPRQSQVVELRYFGGLTQPEIASLLGLHVNTVARDLRLAEAWLLRELERE